VTQVETPRTAARARWWLVPAWVAGVAAGVAAFIAVVAWALPDEQIQGALLGPTGFVVAFVVGMVSFFSPCVLPLLPGYLTFVSGISGEELASERSRHRVLAGTGLFVLGFAVIFTALGAVASGIGGALNENLSLLFRIAGVIVILMGLAFFAPPFLRFLEVERRPFMERVRPGLAGAFPLGLAFGMGWVPCVGPGLGIILTLGVVEGTVLKGALLTFFFSLGFGIWFLLAGIGTKRALQAAAWLRRRTRLIQAVGGVFMIAIGVLLVTDQWARVMGPVQSWLNSLFIPPV